MYKRNLLVGKYNATVYWSVRGVFSRASYPNLTEAARAAVSERARAALQPASAAVRPLVRCARYWYPHPLLS